MTDPKGERPDTRPRLNRTDAWLLAALTEGSHDGRPVTLQEFVHDADWAGRMIPTFDEMSFGLPRLVAAGFMTVGDNVKPGIVFRATPKATRLRKSIKARTIGDVLVGMAQAVGAEPYPDPEPLDDRSLGRLPGLEREDLDAVVQAHGEWVDRWAGPLVSVAHAVTKWQSRNRS
jgi:hypothetical protein